MLTLRTIPKTYCMPWRVLLFVPALLGCAFLTVAVSRSLPSDLQRVILLSLGGAFIASIVLGAVAVYAHLMALQSQLEDDIVSCPMCRHRLENDDALLCSECGASCTRADARLILKRYVQLFLHDNTVGTREWRASLQSPLLMLRRSSGRMLIAVVIIGAAIGLPVISRALFISSVGALVIPALVIVVIIFWLKCVALVSARESFARHIHDSHLQAHPQRRFPGHKSFQMTDRARAIPASPENAHEYWIEHGPIDWDVIDYDKVRDELRRIVPLIHAPRT